ELYVRFRIENPLTPEPEGVDRALANRFPPFEKDRPKSHLCQEQTGEEPAGSQADDDGPHGKALWRLGWKVIGRVGCRRDVRLPASPPQDLCLPVCLDIQVVHEGDRPTFAGVEAAAKDRIADQLFPLDTELFLNRGPQ